LLELLDGWTSTLGAPRLGALGMASTDIDAVLGGVSTSSLAGNPVELTRDDLVGILRASL
jgi:hypothetical protein